MGTRPPMRVKEYQIIHCRIRLLKDRLLSGLTFAIPPIEVEIIPAGTILKITAVTGVIPFAQVNSRVALAFQRRFEGVDWEFIW